MTMSKISTIIDIVFLSLAVAAMSMTLTKAELFTAARKWIQRWSQFLWWPGWVLRKLTTCPYCMAHWWAILAIAHYRTVIIESKVVFVDLSVSAGAVIALSAFWCGLIFKAFKQMGPSEEDEE
jgi:hypothetical protein